MGNNNNKTEEDNDAEDENVIRAGEKFFELSRKKIRRAGDSKEYAELLNNFNKFEILICMITRVEKL